MTTPTLDVVVPALSATTWVAVALALAALVAVTLVCVTRARRLDRLHRRTDAARAGLGDALDRRGTVALRVADVAARRVGAPADLRPVGLQPVDPRHPDARPVDVGAVRQAAHAALTACRAGVRSAGADFEPCEVAENTLTRRLAAVDRVALPTALVEELVDAEQLVLLARRVYNDAVRDTLDLRSRRLVRWLRLAGWAPAPSYFEIADPVRVERPVADRARPVPGHAPDAPAPATGAVPGTAG